MPAPLVNTNDDGDSTAAVAAGVTGNTVIKAGSGALAKVLVTSTNGAAAISIYDANGPTSGSVAGTVIGVVPASAAVGSIYSLGMPFQNGLTVGGAATNGAITISFH